MVTESILLDGAEDGLSRGLIPGGMKLLRSALYLEKEIKEKDEDMKKKNIKAKGDSYTIEPDKHATIFIFTIEPDKHATACGGSH